MKKTYTLRGICVLLLCVLLTFSSSVIFIKASTDNTTTPKEANDAHSLPYSAELAFAQDGSAVGEAKVRDIKCKRLSIVTVSAIGKSEHDRIELRAYSDSGDLISISSADEGERCTIQLLPSYTGTYQITVACRNTTIDISEVSLYASEYTKYKLNETDTFPISEAYTKKNHKNTHASSFLPPRTKDADGWVVSVFSFSHDAGDALSYKVSTAGDMVVRAVLFTYEGGAYHAHGSYEVQTYEAADAQKLHYKGNAYLLVYSSGEFTLEADLLKCRTSEPEPISLPCTGKLDTTGGTKCYDEDEYARLISEFPFCDVKNTYVKYFSVEADANTVISLMCERREHTSFAIVSDMAGLSSESLFPLRSYSSYCSETQPTKMCLDTVICDSGKAYIAYTGSSLDAYVEIKAAPLYSAELTYENEYHKNTPIPAQNMDRLYSDSALFARLGLSNHDSESIETLGYIIECEDGTKYYYDTEDEILPPEKKGDCRLYTVVRRICVRDGWGSSQTHLVLMCTFKTTGVLFIPTIEEILENIENKQHAPFLYILILLTVGAVAGIAVYVVLRKKKRSSRDITPDDIADTRDKKETEKQDEEKQDD